MLFGLPPTPLVQEAVRCYPRVSRGGPPVVWEPGVAGLVGPALAQGGLRDLDQEL